jgi:hypothetical protein
MYDLTTNIETEQSGLSYIAPGIHENLRLVKPDGSAPIVYEKSKNNSEFIAFHFLNLEGQTLVHTEWVPVSDDADIKAKKDANLTKRLLHIGKKFVSADAFKAMAKTENFEQMAKAYIAIIGDNYKGKLLRGKVIYNNKNFTTFPNYVPFLEPMSIPLEDSKLKMSGDDKVVKSKADVIPSRPNPFTASTTVVPETNDVNNLPF